MTGQMPFMTESQFRRAKKLVRSLCANLDYGNCLMLDTEYGTCVCPQLISYSLICKYFHAAVLPADKELYAEIMEPEQRRQCGGCLQLFTPDRKNTLYCKFCAAKRKRESNRRAMEKYRGKVRKVSW